MPIKPEIFKEYDVRGIYPSEIDAGISYKISSAFAEFLDLKNISGPIVVGRDVRLSSEELAEAVANGLCDRGRDVIDIGLATTPLFYFSVGRSEAAGGIMVTASHNPGNYNGLKFIKEGVVPVTFEDGIKTIHNISQKDLPRKLSRGIRRPDNFSESYIDFLVGISDIRRKLKIVVDASNGSAGPFLTKLFQKIDVYLEPLFFEMDGNFPNHPPDPLKPESLKECKKWILKSKADLGAVLDADGDRVIFIDEKGEGIASFNIGSWLVDDFVLPGDKVIIDKRASKSLKEKILEKEGVPVYSRAGHTNIRGAMAENNAVFSAELSGHYFYKDFYNSDSSLFTLVRVLSLLSKKEKKLSEIISGYQKYFHSGEINFKCADFEKMLGYLKGEYASGEQDFLDGLTISYPDWWFNIRPSKTEPLIRLIIEADTGEKMEGKVAELMGKIERFK